MRNRHHEARAAGRGPALLGAALLGALLLLVGPAGAVALGSIEGGALPAPLDPSSTSFIGFINNGGTRRLHPDFGGEVFPGSDGVGAAFYPIPAEAITQSHWVEGGDPGNVDLRGGEDRPVGGGRRRHLHDVFRHHLCGGRLDARDSHRVL